MSELLLRRFIAFFRVRMCRSAMIFAARCGFRASNGEFCAEPRQRLFRLLLPFGAAESLRGNGVPFHGFGLDERFLLQQRELPCHHRVVRALVELGEFCVRVRGIFRLADTRLDLAPISHGEAL